MKLLITYKPISEEVGRAVMDGTLTIAFCLQWDLVRATETTVSWTENQAQIQTGRSFGERERIR